MARVNRGADDFVILNRSNVATTGGWVDVFDLLGPGLDPVGLHFRTREDAEAKGHELAESAGVSLWYEGEPQKSEYVLVATYRK